MGIVIIKLSQSSLAGTELYNRIKTKLIKWPPKGGGLLSLAGCQTKESVLNTKRNTCIITKKV